ncbi:hypothetical protein PR202_ga23694 [Eleusine coracana subsp. coracana]|uniref:Glycosyltransferase 61 catalytic domain-containing protein n=1 Tax=Eleusine coracana subsp. coracana TaxID=191504 RepID=A0AAV5D7I9_ELECO|nr:hypothetical protein PR202_ga23694 [Eleusine coracana subsp. coracana]
MKGGLGGGEKQGRGRTLPRLESQRFRLLSIVVGCFVFSVVFLLSSRPDATAFDTSHMTPKAALEDARKPATAVKTLRSSGGFGVRDTVIVEERRSDVEREAELDDHESSAAGVTSNSDDQPARGMKEEVQANAVQTTAITGQPAVETTPGQPAEEAARQVGVKKVQQEQPPARQEKLGSSSSSSSSGQKQQPLCDFSDHRSDVCEFAGDVRLDANASSFIVVVDPTTSSTEWHRVRPYPRKGDETCMSRITALTVRRSNNNPRCTAMHASPAVAFATGGYTGNIFHDFSDLVMANVASWWLVKYARLLRVLSRHPVIDLAKAGANGEVHCFPRAVVGLRAHRELIIEPGRSADGLATPDFTRFVRRALGLPRDAPTPLGDTNTTTSIKKSNKPRLLIISRHRTRLLLNLAAVVRAAEEVGFEAVVNESDVGNDIAQVGSLINSCDAMVGVHGAGLTNMMFLPPGATLVQIVPWGGLQWMARADYGDPAEAMGLKYIQYEVGVEESTLKDKYPRDHQIFTDPTGMHKKGFGFIRQTLMDGQDINVDLGRFREVLIQVLNNLTP